MAPSLENERVEYFCFRLAGMASDGRTEDYVPYGLPSCVFKGTLTQARDEAESFRYEEDEHAAGVCIYAKRNQTWQEVESSIGWPDD